MSCQLSQPLTHSQIIIAIITKAEWHRTGSDLLAVKTETTTERFPCALLFAAPTRFS
jgi:hypothetical protein